MLLNLHLSSVDKSHTSPKLLTLRKEGFGDLYGEDLKKKERERSKSLSLTDNMMLEM